MKTIVAAIFESARAMRNVIIHALFCLVIFSLIGLQVYMGTLTQRCMTLSKDENPWTLEKNNKYGMCPIIVSNGIFSKYFHKIIFFKYNIK